MTYHRRLQIVCRTLQRKYYWSESLFVMVWMMLSLNIQHIWFWKSVMLFQLTSCEQCFRSTSKMAVRTCLCHGRMKFCCAQNSPQKKKWVQSMISKWNYTKSSKFKCCASYLTFCITLMIHVGICQLNVAGVMTYHWIMNYVGCTMMKWLQSCQYTKL